MATKLFGADFPEWFETLGLFPISDYDAGKLVDGDSAAGDGGLCLRVDVLFPFIMMTTFAVVNLLVGLIVNSM